MYTWGWTWSRLCSCSSLGPLHCRDSGHSAGSGSDQWGDSIISIDHSEALPVALGCPGWHYGGSRLRWGGPAGSPGSVLFLVPQADLKWDKITMGQSSFPSLDVCTSEWIIPHCDKFWIILRDSDWKSSLTSNGTEEVLRMAVHQASESNQTEILNHVFNEEETDPGLGVGPKFIPGKPCTLWWVQVNIWGWGVKCTL